jgi:hypothetical protein
MDEKMESSFGSTQVSSRRCFAFHLIEKLQEACSSVIPGLFKSEGLPKLKDDQNILSLEDLL